MSDQPLVWLITGWVIQCQISLCFDLYLGEWYSLRSASSWIYSGFNFVHFMIFQMYFPSSLEILKKKKEYRYFILFYSATFIRNNAHSEAIWKFQRYQLIVNYELRPLLPPPMILFSHVFLSLKYIFRRFKGKRDLFDNGLSKYLNICKGVENKQFIKKRCYCLGNFYNNFITFL